MVSKAVRFVANAAQVARHALDSGQEMADIVDDARALYERFHWGNEPVELVQVQGAPDVKEGDVLVVLGELRRLDYLTEKQDTEAIWYHEFERDRPKLCATIDGRLVIVGGTYRVTTQGIVG